MSEYVSKRSMDQDAKKRKEVAVGLANNATGAAFGAVATQQAVAAARAKMKDKNAPDPEKLSVRAGRRIARKYPAVGRAAMRFKPKDPKKALLALGAVNVGGQALNAAMDAQSASYFARERRALKAKQTGNIRKFDSGMSTGVELYKSESRASAKRAYQQGLGTAAGVGMFGAGAGLAGYNAVNAKVGRGIAPGQSVREAYLSDLSRPQLKAAAKKLKSLPKRAGGRLIIPAALMGGGGYVAQRSYRMGRNESRQSWH